MNIIEKLNKIDVKELQTFDYAKAFNKFKSRPEVIVAMLAIVGALFASMKIYTNTQDEMRATKANIMTIEEKIAAYDNYKKAQTDLTKFFGKIPASVGEDNLMNLLTDFAVKRKVQIESFSPIGGKNTPFTSSSGLSLNISSEDYKDLWLFIHDIEESKYSIYIPRLKLVPGQETKIGVQLDVLSVNIKKDEK